MIETIGREDPASRRPSAADKDIDMTIVVVIRPRAAKGGGQIGDQWAVGHRAEGPVAVVAVKITVRLVSRIFRSREEVQKPVIVEIYCRHIEGIGDISNNVARGLSPREGSVAVVMIKNFLPSGRDIEVWVTIVVIVSPAGAGAIDGNIGLKRGDLCKGPIAIVVIELGRPKIAVRPWKNEGIEEAVVVKVSPGGTSDPGRAGDDDGSVGDLSEGRINRQAEIAADGSIGVGDDHGVLLGVGELRRKQGQGGALHRQGNALIE